jgi:DNA modification methylase
MIELKQVAFEDFVPDRKIDLCFCDPPDNQGLKYDLYVDKIPTNDYVTKLRAWLKKANDICDGPIFFSFAQNWTPDVEIAIRDLNIKVIQRLMWHFGFGQNLKTKYAPCLRPIYWLRDNRIFPEPISVPSARQTKYHDQRANPGGKLPECLWEFPRVCGTFKARRRWHPTQFPIALLERIILGHSTQGMTVLDGFIGSGTTAYACLANHRNCVGLDVSNSYLAHIRDELIGRGASDADIIGGV